MHYVYFVKRGDNHSTYIGVTKNIQRRVREHKAKIPDLIYYEAYKDKRDALDRERKLKQRGQTIRRLKEKLKYSLN